MSIKKFIKSATPPILLDFYRHASKGSISYSGNYKTWKEAKLKSTGYHQNAILERVRESARKVKDGTAAYERDGVVLEKIDYAWPVLACLQNAAIQSRNRLQLIDLGGSLGTSYYQNKKFLQNLQLLRWHIVEQENYVETGKKEFENEQLKFASTIEEVTSKEKVNCLLISGSIQYFEDPKEWFEKLQQYNIPFIIFDRISFINDVTRIMVQHVPASVYNATLPCWFFNELEFLESFAKKYEVIADFESTDESTRSLDLKKLYWKGFYLKLK